MSATAELADLGTAPTEDGDSFDALLREVARCSAITGSSARLPGPGDIVAGKYRIERILGRGGMGAVFEITHLALDKRFALKWILAGALCSADAKERLLREARVASRVQVPAVVQIYDVGEDGGVPFLVMELLNGESLGTRLERGPMTLAQTCEVLGQVLRALADLHRAGVVHRDLKPENIQLTSQDGAVRAKILDFGISKILADGVPGNTITRAGAAVGTPAFMSPEQHNGEAADERSDIYSLGVTMFVMLTGKLPFQSESYGGLVRQIMIDAPPKIRTLRPDLPKRVESIVSKAMARDPKERFASAAELDGALQMTLQPEPRTGRRWIAWIVAIATSALQLAAWAVLRERPIRAASPAVQREVEPPRGSSDRDAPPRSSSTPPSPARAAGVDLATAEPQAEPEPAATAPASKPRGPVQASKPRPSQGGVLAPVEPPPPSPSAQGRAGELELRQF